jgi:hypothetical protein
MKNIIERFRKLCIKRGLTPGALLDASPEDFDLLLLALRREFPEARNYSERDVNEVLHEWLQTTGAMLDVDHVELRRWLVDFAMLSRDAYGHAYTLAPIPPRLKDLESAIKAIDFRQEFADANAADSQQRASRKAAWLLTQNRLANG